MAKRTVQTERRRRSETPSGGRQRAETPQRRRPSSSSSSSSSGSSGSSYGGQSGGSSGGGYIPSSGGTGFPLGGGGGMSGSTMLILGVIIAIVICGFFALNLFNGGSEDGGLFEEPAQSSGQTGGFEDQPPLDTGDGGLFDGGAAEEEEAPVVEPFTPPAVSADGDTWLVMLYQDADDKILEQDIYLDLNEAERIGSTDRVQIVAQVDRFQGGYSGDGDWTGTRRYYITPDPSLNQLSSQLIEDLGEVNMADEQTLVDFVTWSMDTFEADKYVLIMSDHGMGWPGGWTDPTAPNRGADNVALAQNGDMLFLMELDRALTAIREQTGLEKFELIGLDACLMAHVEVNSALAPHARYAVASQEVEPALGWAYAGFLNQLAANPDMSGAELGRIIVDSYIREDQRIVDNQARAEFASGGASLGSLFGFGSGGGPSAAQLAQQLERDVTLSVVDLEANNLLTESLNNFAFALQDDNQRLVAEARTYAQPFTSIFGSNVPASYIDLAHFAQLLANNSQNQAVVQAANELIGVIDQVVVAEKHGQNKAGANGVSIYFPNSQLYGTSVAGPDSYTTIANRFAAESLWDDFLTFHYTGRLFARGDAAVAIPDRGVELEGPGSGDISIAPITISDNSVALGESVLLTIDLEGESIGYVYFFAGFLDEGANSIYVADTDYLDSGDTREIEGVYYPEWGEGEFTLEFNWEPIVYGINDGTTVVSALFQPETYGAAPEDAIYTVEGIYTYADGTTRRGRLYFSNEDGMLVQVYGYTGENEEALGAPREIIPAAGDSFTVLEQWMDLDESGSVASIEEQEGGTVTFSDVPLVWEELDAAAGTYIVGFIVEDLDGKRFPVYEQVVVE